MEKNFNKILLAILAFSILSIFSAYFIEYVLGHKPCKLCLYQRYPYFVSVFLILNILVLKKYVKLTLLTLALVSFFGSAIAFYHFGIEQGFFNESLICEAKNFENNFLSHTWKNSFVYLASFSTFPTQKILVKTNKLKQCTMS